MPENIDEDDHDENQEIFAFVENMNEKGHDENLISTYHIALTI